MYHFGVCQYQIIQGQFCSVQLSLKRAQQNVISSWIYILPVKVRKFEVSGKRPILLGILPFLHKEIHVILYSVI